MKTTTSKKSGLGNTKNKARLITKLMEKFEENGISVKQSNANADFLIVATALERDEQQNLLLLLPMTEICSL